MVKHPDMFENCIKEAAKREIESIPVPNMEDVWLNIEENLYKKQKKNNTVLVKRIAIGVAAVLLISLSFTNEYTRVIGYVSEVLENTVAMQIDLRKEAKNRAAKGNTEATVYTLTLQEATERASFSISIPQVLPAGYALKDVNVTELGKDTLKTELIYSNKTMDFITLKQAPVEQEAIVVDEIMTSSKAIETKEVAINGIAYKIISFDDGYMAVYWEKGNMRYLLEGMEKDQLMDISASIE